MFVFSMDAATLERLKIAVNKMKEMQNMVAQQAQQQWSQLLQDNTYNLIHCLITIYHCLLTIWCVYPHFGASSHKPVPIAALWCIGHE